MGKKDLFKFPSKKTLEYILIGILFVAVLSCTIKMMNISFNNILEGFDCEQRTGAGTCTRISGDGGGSMIFTGNAEMASGGQASDELNGDLLFTFKKADQSEEVLAVVIDNTAKTPSELIDLINSQIIAENLTDLIVFKGTSEGDATLTDKLNFITLPGSNYTRLTINYTSDGDVGSNVDTAAQQGHAARIFGLTIPERDIDLTPINTCQVLFEKLESNYRERTDAEANTKISLGGEMSCLSVCEEESLGECPSDGINSGCELNSDSDTCECGGSTGLGSFVKNSGYNFDDNDVDNCLKSQITEIYGSDGTLGTRSGGWTIDGTGDVCSPRRPCLDNQEAYLNIINKEPDQCNPGNNYEDNEMRLNFCQPFGEKATFTDCNRHNNQTDCETEGSKTDNTQCTWNPYCLSQKGLDKVIGGIQTDDDRLTCQGINDHQSCNAASDCYWDWILAEELNGFRGSDNRITEDTPKIKQLKEPGLFTTYLSNCKTNGGTLDNSKCSFYSGIQTLNSTDNRPKGYCRKEDCDYDEGTEHSLCSYCSTFALEDNTPSIVPETISDFVEWTREQTGTSNSQSQQATPNQCYQIFRR